MMSQYEICREMSLLDDVYQICLYTKHLSKHCTVAFLPKNDGFKIIFL